MKKQPSLAEVYYHNVKSIRLARGDTIHKLSAQAGMTPSWWGSTAEGGNSSFLRKHNPKAELSGPTLATVEKVAKVLDVDVALLLNPDLVVGKRVVVVPERRKGD